MIDYSKLTIKSASDLLKKKEISVSDLVAYYVKNLKEKNPEINAVLEIFSDIDVQVKSAQEKIDNGTSTELTGIPMVMKDNIMIHGRVASASSKVLEKYVATYTSTAAQKLIDQGVVILGRANMDEFAMGGSTENSAFGPTRNPIDTTRVSGGSSGGSAAAVAMDGAIFALGSDTGGSIRQPASFCGIVGLKPTYGSVSRHGLMAMASSLDVIGPITKNVEDAEIVFNAIRGIDTKDATTVTGKTSKTEVKKIGVPMSYMKKGLDADVLETFQKSLEKFKSAGIEIVDIDLPNLDYSLAVYYVLVPAEVSSNMARFDGIKYGSRVEGDNLLGDYMKTRGQLIGREVKRRIMLGAYVLSAGYADEYYRKAWQVRHMIGEDFKKAFEKVDLIAVPTSPTPAFKIGEKSGDPMQMYLADIFTIFANLVGVPAISIPDGFVKRDGIDLPNGLQLIAPHLGEQLLFDIGKKFEKM